MAMAIIKLSEFRDETIVLHFGGAVGTIDAYTLAEALIGFADTARAVSSIVDPGTEIEILVEATGPGSYRTVIRRIKKGAKGLLAGALHAVFWGVVANIIYDAKFKTADPPPQITVTTNEVIIKLGNDTIIVPRNVHDATENAKKNPAVQRGIRKTFEALEFDKSITEFGVTGSITDHRPLITIPRSEFPIFAHTAVTAIEEVPTERMQKQRARLIVLKAWLNHAKRKWSFEWNGVPISAPIADVGFLD